jgi:hypothetical protein
MEIVFEVYSTVAMARTYLTRTILVFNDKILIQLLAKSSSMVLL